MRRKKSHHQQQQQEQQQQQRKKQMSVSINHVWTTLLKVVRSIFRQHWYSIVCFRFVIFFYSINFRWCKLFWSRQIWFCACLEFFFHTMPRFAATNGCFCVQMVVWKIGPNISDRIERLSELFFIGKSWTCFFLL